MQDVPGAGLGWRNGLRQQEKGRIRGSAETMAKLTMAKTKLQAMKATPMAKITEVSRWGNGRGGRPWRRLRERILERDLYTCQNNQCAKVTDYLEVDHIISLSQGGTDDESNLMSLCPDCHLKKTLAESRGETFRYNL